MNLDYGSTSQDHLNSEAYVRWNPAQPRDMIAEAREFEIWKMKVVGFIRSVTFLKQNEFWS